MKEYKQEKNWKYVEEFIEELKTAKYWFKNEGKPKPEWKLFETRDAAKDAAEDAARDAALYSAWDVALYAAWDAARYACIFSGMLVCFGLNIELKHLIHLNARMEVWRKGYGLFCDVEGVMYVYKKP